VPTRHSSFGLQPFEKSVARSSLLMGAVSMGTTLGRHTQHIKAFSTTKTQKRINHRGTKAQKKEQRQSRRVNHEDKTRHQRIIRHSSERWNPWMPGRARHDKLSLKLIGFQEPSFCGLSPGF
jgi:hypothetical protein